jgi:hypothetical protein
VKIRDHINSCFVADASQWELKPNRRKFIDSLADELGFSPLEVQKWYGISAKDILSRKVSICEIVVVFSLIVFQGGSFILAHYGGSFVKALVDLYPELEFQQRHFGSMISK